MMKSAFLRARTKQINYANNHLIFSRTSLYASTRVCVCVLKHKMSAMCDGNIRTALRGLLYMHELNCFDGSRAICGREPRKNIVGLG